MKSKGYEDTGRLHRIIIEPKDLEIEGRGVEIQVKGFKGSPEEVDALNTHVYIEKWEGKTQILIWGSGENDPIKVVLEPSTDDLADHDLFECSGCERVLDIEESIENQNGELVCERCYEYLEEKVRANCGHYVAEEEMITHKGITCCPDCYERVK